MKQVVFRIEPTPHCRRLSAFARLFPAMVIAAGLCSVFPTSEASSFHTTAISREPARIAAIDPLAGLTDSRISRILVSRDGTRAAFAIDVSGSASIVRILDLKSGSRVAQIDLTNDPGHSPDDTLSLTSIDAVGSRAVLSITRPGARSEARVYDIPPLRSPTPRETLRVPFEAFGEACLAPDGRQLLTVQTPAGDLRNLAIHSVESGDVIWRGTVRRSVFVPVLLQPLAPKLRAIWMWDTSTRPATHGLYDLETKQFTPLDTGESSLTSARVLFTDNGELIALDGTSVLSRYDLRKGIRTERIGLPIEIPASRRVAFSADARWLLAENPERKVIQIIDINTGNLAGSIPADRLHAAAAGVALVERGNKLESWSLPN
jgi:hypothetical protein